MFAVIFYVNLEIYQLLAQTDVDSMWTNMDLCRMVRIRVEWCGFRAEWCGIHAEWCGIHAEWCGIRVSPHGIHGIRAEHQGECKLLKYSTNLCRN